MRKLPCLSIRQPWAWLIVQGHKPVENRTWSTPFRGELLIHAGKTMSRRYYDQFQQDLMAMLGAEAPQLPAFDDLPLGGIIGTATMTDCVERHPSPYFFGPFGFVLRDAKPLTFVPYRGMLGFFNVDASVLEVGR